MTECNMLWREAPACCDLSRNIVRLRLQPLCQGSVVILVELILLPGRAVKPQHRNVTDVAFLGKLLVWAPDAMKYEDNELKHVYGAWKTDCLSLESKPLCRIPSKKNEIINEP